MEESWGEKRVLNQHLENLCASPTLRGLPVLELDTEAVAVPMEARKVQVVRIPIVEGSAEFEVVLFDT